MKFQHLVEVDDPSTREVESLSREQVWRGLVQKAENPLLFVSALDDFKVLARDGDSIRRELRFGRVAVRDTITLLPPDRICQKIEATPQVPGATLTTTIETHAGARLFVRFEYEIAPLAAAVEDFVKQAYVEADNDALRSVRRLAAEGKL